MGPSCYLSLGPSEHQPDAQITVLCPEGWKTCNFVVILLLTKSSCFSLTQRPIYCQRAEADVVSGLCGLLVQAFIFPVEMLSQSTCINHTSVWHSYLTFAMWHFALLPFILLGFNGDISKVCL